MNKAGEKKKKETNQTKKQTPNCSEKTKDYQRGGGAGLGETVKSYLEHRVMYRAVESLYCTPEADIALYVNYTRIQVKKF